MITFGVHTACIGGIFITGIFGNFYTNRGGIFDFQNGNSRWPCNANAFTDYFASVVVNSNNLTPTIPSYHIVSPLASISLSEGDVLAAINKLKSNLSAGPDGLPPLLFKRVNQLYAFQRYCRFYSPGRHFFPFRTSPIVSLKFPHVPLPWE